MVGTVVLGRRRPRGIRPVEAGTQRVEVVDVDTVGGQALEGGADAGALDVTQGVDEGAQRGVRVQAVAGTGEGALLDLRLRDGVFVITAPTEPRQVDSPT